MKSDLRPLSLMRMLHKAALKVLHKAARFSRTYFATGRSPFRTFLALPGRKLKEGCYECIQTRFPEISGGALLISSLEGAVSTEEAQAL
jgi:hypothetical protein